MYNNFWLGGKAKIMPSPTQSPPRPKKRLDQGATDLRAMEQTRKRKEKEASDLRNSLRCEAICVAHHLLPSIREIREWMSEWKKWELEQPSWFVTNRIVLLTALDANMLGRAWVLENFWGSGDDELMFLAATCDEAIRPPLEDIVRWLHER